MAIALRGRVSLLDRAVLDRRILDRRLDPQSHMLTRKVWFHTFVFLRRQALQATAICCRLALPLVGDSSLADPELLLELACLLRERTFIALGTRS
jgi:hypothetical protein